MTKQFEAGPWIRAIRALLVEAVAARPDSPNYGFQDHRRRQSSDPNDRISLTAESTNVARAVKRPPRIVRNLGDHRLAKHYEESLRDPENGQPVEPEREVTT